MVWASSCCCTCSAVFVPQPVSRETAITNAASREIRRCSVFLFVKSFSSQLLGSCRFATKLLWLTCRTSPPARVCAVKPAHGNDAAIFACFLFCTAPFPRKAQHKSDIKIFYHYQEGFSINFHIFIRKNHAHPISLRQRMCLFAKGRQKGSFGADKRPGKAPFAGIGCSVWQGQKFLQKISSASKVFLDGRHKDIHIDRL